MTFSVDADILVQSEVFETWVVNNELFIVWVVGGGGVVLQYTLTVLV
jgi:hypothetical protein